MVAGLRVVVVLTCALFCSCGAEQTIASPDGTVDAMPDGGDAVSDAESLIQARPYISRAPADYDPATPLPLVILLHGYSSNGAWYDQYFGLGQLVDSAKFLYAYPDGTTDRFGQRFWNATDACCDLYGAGVDDVAYLNAVIDDMSRRYNVDPRRVYFVGHSNGAFMSHRMACDSARRIAAIVAVSGDNWKDVSRCTPSEPVAVLQVHGDADQLIRYAGGTVPFGGSYPSAHDSVAGWAANNGCQSTIDTSAASLDLESALAGEETKVERWPGCTGGAAELWTIQGGDHMPSWQPSFAATIYAFLAAHPKP